MTATAKIVESLRSGMEQLNQFFVDREDEIRGLAAAMIARVPVLLYGPPGVGKSALVRSFAKLIDGRFFYYLMRGDSTPQELIGLPLYEHMKEGNIVFNSKGKIVDAHVVFLDEFFRASSPVTDTLLPIMEERVFMNNQKPVRAKWSLWVAATNFIPRDEELEAMLDRYVLRYAVRPLDFDGFVKMWSRDEMPEFSSVVNVRTLDTLHKACKQVHISPDIIQKVGRLRANLRGNNFSRASERRWNKIKTLMRAHALLDGRDYVDSFDMNIIPFCLWEHPDEIARIQAIVAEYQDRVSAKLSGILRSIEEVVNKWNERAKADWEPDNQQAALQEALKDSMQIRSNLERAAAFVNNLSASEKKDAKHIFRRMEAMHAYLKAVSQMLTEGNPLPEFTDKK